MGLNRSELKLSIKYQIRLSAKLVAELSLLIDYLIKHPPLRGCRLGNEVLKELQLVWQLLLFNFLLQSSLHQKTSDTACIKKTHCITNDTACTFLLSSFSTKNWTSSIKIPWIASTAAAIWTFSTSSEPAKPA